MTSMVLICKHSRWSGNEYTRCLAYYGTLKINWILKDGIKGLGANKTDRAITRLGKCIDSIVIDKVLKNFDEHQSIHSTSDYYTMASLQKDVGYWDYCYCGRTTKANMVSLCLLSQHSHDLF